MRLFSWLWGEPPGRDWAAPPTDLVSLLVHANSLIQRGWTQRYFATDAQGDRVEFISDKACKFCAMGAIYRVVEQYNMPPYFTGQAFDLLGVYIPKKAPEPEWQTLSQYNDRPGRTQAEVSKVFDRAIRKLLKREKEE